MDKHIDAQSINNTLDTFPSLDQVSAQYEYIMQNEEYLTSCFWQYPEPREMHIVAQQILETAKLNFVPKGYNHRYANYPSTYVVESVSAQIVLTISIVMKALDFKYWSNFSYTKEGYNFQEIVNAIIAYHQPKAKYGDAPDNTDQVTSVDDEETKQYYKNYFDLEPNRTRTIIYRVKRLLSEIKSRSSSTGRLVFVANYIATSIAMLSCDWSGVDLMMKPDSATISRREQQEMILCDRHKDGACYASEMRAIDYFKKSHVVAYDDYGICTALLVMCTLLVNNGQWYTWREENYS